MHFYRELIAVFSLTFAASILNAADTPKQAKRLESVTWNPVTHRLTWTVSQGTLDEDGGFKAAGEATSYEIDMNEATMTLNGEGRRFSREEAVRVSALMGLVAEYAAESTVWWDTGHGEPLDGSRPLRRRQPREDQPARPNRVEAPASVVRIAYTR